jgi:hypothetical protein
MRSCYDLRTGSVRRLISITLLALGGDAESGLPVCCRRHGKHHCMMTHLRSTSSGPSFQAQPCPFYPTASTAPRLTTASLATSLPSSLELIRDTAPLAASPRPAQTFATSAHYTRGPPTPLA